MKSTDNEKNKITLESINEKLESIKCDIKELPKQEESKNFFGATVLISFSLVLVAIAIPLLLELLELPKLALWLTFFFYFVLAIAFILIARKLLSEKK